MFGVAFSKKITTHCFVRMIPVFQQFCVQSTPNFLSALLEHLKNTVLFDVENDVFDIENDVFVVENDVFDVDNDEEFFKSVLVEH